MPDALFSVRDQVVLVSGGTRGIGRAIAMGFAARGAQVIVSGRQAETTAKAAADMNAALAEAPAGHAVVGIACDVADVQAIRQCVADVVAQCGRIDTLVNCAGVNRRKPAMDVTEEDYDFVVDVNLKGAFFMSQEVGRHMQTRHTGAQINIASLNTDRPLLNVSPYAMSKAGMAGMTRALAAEWGPHGVRVNALAPGFILTDLTEKLWSDPTMHAWGVANTPQRRLGLPEDMVGTALFLASPAAAFLTGQIIYVDGGFTAAWHWPIA
ncbi:MAG: glucose 1-dehydrogenase [Planctomycetales bacterium]|nr:glucose 1-dehydrogenase [Planctomycetales bacterium]